MALGDGNMNFLRSVRISPFSLIRVERRLPFPGEVLVRPGESVEPQQTIAVAERRGWVCLEVAKELGVKEEELERFLKKKPGEKIEAGEELASRKGFLPFTYVSYASPVSGRVAAIGMGMVILETVSGNIELKAGLKGTVSEIIPYYGAIIESKGALVEGAWSNNKEKGGIVKVATDKDKALTPEALQTAVKGFVLICGTIQDEGTLSKAAALQIGGIVAGSLKATLRDQALSMPYPIILTEGFGETPMNSAAFELFRTAEGYEVTLLASPPSIVISVAEDLLAPGVTRRETSSKVKVSRGPYKGLLGEPLEKEQRELLLESGYITPAMLVRLENGVEVRVPIANLEAIES
jgi:hypothetical protein